MDPITDLLSGVERHTDRFFGKFRGRVRDNDDPLKLGRIRASVPQILQDQDTGWALPALPYSGQGVGVYTIPAIDAGVWIEFEAGDVSQPIWSGCWWSDGQLPIDESGTGQTPDMKIIRTEKGLLLALDDGGETIALSDSNGNNIMKIRVQDGRITIQAAQKVVVEAPQIELVENATHPLVFGDNLLTYLNQLVQMFNSHMHPGQLAAGVIPVTPAPPVPFFPPAQPSLLSTRVKTG